MRNIKPSVFNIKRGDEVKFQNQQIKIVGRKHKRICSDGGYTITFRDKLTNEEITIPYSRNGDVCNDKGFEIVEVKRNAK